MKRAFVQPHAMQNSEFTPITNILTHQKFVKSQSLEPVGEGACQWVGHLVHGYVGKGRNFDFELCACGS